MTERTNQEWLDALRGEDRDEALADLRAFLVHGLRYALASWPAVDGATLEDLAQEALLKILNGLDSFRGESRFTTWAQKIAVNFAFTELRRRRWQEVSLDDLGASSQADFVPEALVDPSADPEKQALQRRLLETLRQTIATELTDRQRQALVAARIQGMPLAEVARRMGTNRNALYKLLYDARQRLKKQLEAQGLPPQEILAAFES